MIIDPETGKGGRESAKRLENRRRLKEIIDAMMTSVGIEEPKTEGLETRELRGVDLLCQAQAGDGCGGQPVPITNPDGSPVRGQDLLFLATKGEGGAADEAAAAGELGDGGGDYVEPAAS